jgi:hypothetical protein
MGQPIRIMKTLTNGAASTSYPSATADGTDCLQVRIWTLEAKLREGNSGARNFNFAAKYLAISSPFRQKNQRTRNGTDRAQSFMTGSA